MKITLYSYVYSRGEGSVGIKYFTTKALRDEYSQKARENGYEDPTCYDSELTIDVSPDGEIYSNPECTTLNSVYY